MLKKTIWWHEQEATEYNCDKCEKKFKNLFVKRHHLCKQVTKYACPICEFFAVTLGELETHIEMTHLKIKLVCECCNYETDSDESLNANKQTEHKMLKVDITKKDQVVVTCEQCDYKCRLNIQMKKHTKAVQNTRRNCRK